MDNWVLLMKKQKRLKAVEIESVDRNFMRTYNSRSNCPVRIECRSLRHTSGFPTLQLFSKTLYHPQTGNTDRVFYSSGAR